MTDRPDQPAQPQNVPPKKARPEKAPPENAAAPVDEELERERLEPGLNTAGTGDVGAAPVRRKGEDNGNT